MPGWMLLEPMMLWGALAASLPVLFHFLRRQQLQEVDFSGLLFLSKTLRRQVRTSRLSHLLLLLLRIALILVLALAFAQPEIFGLLPRRQGQSIALVVDTSASTGLRMEGKTVLQHLVQQARRILQESGESDRLTLIPAVPPVQVLLADERGAAQEAFQILERLESTALEGNLNEAVQEALGILANSPLEERRLIIFSDGQEAFEAPASGVDGVQVQTVFLAPKQASNLWISSLDLPESPENRAERRFALELANLGNREVNGMVRLNLGGAFRGERTLSLAAGGSARLNFDLPVEPGLQLGFFEVAGDDLEIDNRRYFVLGLEKPLPVALVGREKDCQFLRLALEVREPNGKESFSLSSWTTLEGALSAWQTEETPEVAFLCGLSSPSAQQFSLLDTFRKAGMGVFLLLGAETVPSMVNEAAGNQGIFPVRLTGREEGQWLGVPAERAELPFKKQAQALLRQAPFRERQRVVPLEPNGQVLLKYDDGVPLLLEFRSRSASPFWVLSSSAERSFGDFAISPYFVLLVRHAAQSLSPSSLRLPLSVGQRPPEPAGWWSVQTAVELQSLLSSPVDPTSSTVRTDAPGVLLQRDTQGRLTQWLELRVAPRESQLTGPSEVTEQERSTRLPEQRARQLLSLPLFLLALLLWTAEGLLTHRLAGAEALRD